MRRVVVTQIVVTIRRARTTSSLSKKSIQHKSQAHYPHRVSSPLLLKLCLQNAMSLSCAW